MNTYTITFTGTRKASRCIAKTIVEDVQADDAQAATLKLSEHYADITVIDILWNTPITSKVLANTPLHTSPPYCVRRSSVRPIGDVGLVIADCNSPEQAAFFAMVANAHHDLLAAVKEAKQYLEDVGEVFLDLDGDPQSGCQKMIDILDAALAKAGAQ